MTYTETLNHEQAAPPRQPSLPALDYAKINRTISPDHLAKIYTNDPHKRGPFIMTARQASRIAINVTFGHHTPPLRWVDMDNGVEGVGSIDLIAHVMKITRDESARRLVAFIGVQMNIRASCFDAR